MKLKHLALVMTGVFALTSCGGGSGDKSGLPANTVPVNTSAANPTADANAIAYNDMPVHDPSVIKGDDGYYYVFGSHLAAAKSKDLMKWDVVANGIDDAHPIDSNPLFNTYSSQIANGIAWTDGYKGSWAADVIKAPNGKYWFYYNHCAQSEASGGCWNRSYLGLAESSSITGPFVDKGLLLRSGYRNAGEFTSFPLDNGQKTYNPAVDPNAIDPHVFYDKSGGLWMVYGSYSGGIFVLQLDPATGKAKAGQGYGTHVAGGGFAPIEGSWMIYSPETDYYYMFNSIGGFDAAGGYNIRVSRSKNPNGPFVDSTGSDMLNAKTNVDTLSKYGVKLMGGFNFVSEVGDATTGWGYLSPGHNSVYYDATSKKYFLVTHTRFPNRGEEHSVRVHEMWLNADGWFVASPQRYAPVTGANVVDASDLAGDYRFVGHFRDTNTTGHNSIYVTLNEDRQISGEVTGYYRLSETDNKRITLVITGDSYKGIYSGTYEGVMQWQWDAAAKKLVPTFSALSSAGATVWGSQLESKTTAQALTAALDAIAVPAELTDSSITLPLRATRAAKITWESSAPAVIHLKTDKKTGAQTGVGVINRPSQTAGDKSMVLTATITLNGQTQSRTYNTKVIALRYVAAKAQFDFENNLSDSKGTFPAGGYATGDRIWNMGSVAYAAGVEGNAVSLNGTNGVRLPDGLISNYKYTVSFWIKPTVITGFTTAFFGAKDPDTWISYLPKSWNGGTMLWGRVPQWFDGITGMSIPAGEWSQMTFSVDNGVATAYINGEKKFTGNNVGDIFTGGTGQFALGVNWWDIPFNGLIDNLRVWDQVLTPGQFTIQDPTGKTADQVLALAKTNLTIGDTSSLKADIDLPIAGPYTTAVSWKSSNASVMDDYGTITQPAAYKPDGTATLTATITYGGKSVTKDFAVVVKAKTPPPPVATYSFENNVKDTVTSGMGTIVGNRIEATGGNLTYIAGVKGQAAVFDGATGVVLPDNYIKSHTYSISMWLNPTAATQYTTAFFGWATDSSWISVVPRGPGTDQNTMLWSGTAWFDGNTGYKVPVGSWTHLVLVVDKGVLRAYVNGALSNTMSGFPDVFSSAGVTHTALAVNYWDIPYAGKMDELNIYSDALSEDDIAILYSQGTK